MKKMDNVCIGWVWVVNFCVAFGYELPCRESPWVWTTPNGCAYGDLGIEWAGHGLGRYEKAGGDNHLQPLQLFLSLRPRSSGDGNTPGL